MKNSENLINKISKGKNLTFEESKSIFLDIMSGKMEEKSIYNFLINLSSKGETSEEIAGGVYVLREKALKVKTPEDSVIALPRCAVPEEAKDARLEAIGDATPVKSVVKYQTS